MPAAKTKDAFSSHPQVTHPRFVTKVEAILPELPTQEARIAQYMLLNTDRLSFETGASLAKKVGASEVTVSRFLRRLGYKGMAGLKQEIQIDHATQHLQDDTRPAPVRIDAPLKDILDSEMQALVMVFEQVMDPRWQDLVAAVGAADTVYVTGFQSVRGAAEDFARRLALARDDIRYLSAHDSMLGEWIGHVGDVTPDRRECLIIIDVVPYAREAEALSALCRDHGRDLVVVTDEFCHWAKDYTDLVIHAPSKSGLFLESTVALVAILNLLVHSVAQRDQEATQLRLEHWQPMTRHIKVF